MPSNSAEPRPFFSRRPRHIHTGIYIFNTATATARPSMLSRNVLHPAKFAALLTRRNQPDPSHVELVRIPQQEDVSAYGSSVGNACSCWSTSSGEIHATPTR